MMTVVTPHPGGTSPRPFLGAIMSLNAQRRDDALYLLGCEYGRPLTPYEVCKTHVLADVFHVVQTGKVIFGGNLYAMPFGPVVKRTLDDCARWSLGTILTATHARQPPAKPPPLYPSGWRGSQNQIVELRASPAYDRRDQASWDDFADLEQTHVRRAYEKVAGLSWVRSQAYFHDPIPAIGYAYGVAIQPFPKPFKGRADMNWFDVLDGAETIEAVDVSYARAMLGLWA